MKMYEELVKRLRSHNGWALNKTLDEAADVIESTNKAYQMISEAYEAEVTKQNWIPVTERLPVEKINPNTHDYEWVLCATIWGDVRPYKYGTTLNPKGPHFLHGGGIVDEYITHWMPLPSAPTEE